MQSNHKLRIGIDIMGSDRSLDTFLPELLDLLLLEETLPEIHLFCTNEAQNPDVPPPFHLHRSSSAISMNDHPLHSLRLKKEATMYKGLAALKEGAIDALVSCGNTGALVAGACHFLGKGHSCKKPALLTLLPTKKNPVAVLDVGASIEWDAKTLLSYARLGQVYQKAMGVQNPNVGLLNIGTEETKGNPKHVESYALLEKELGSPSFFGNVEGRDIFQGIVDVIVTDGFTGNVLLKTAEGVSNFLLTRITGQLLDESATQGIFEQLEKDTNYAEYPGAILMGLEKPVIKCHGDFNPLAVKNAILGATKLASSPLVLKLQN